MAMRRKAYTDAISERFSYIAVQLRIRNRANQTDLNVELEPLFCKILNVLNGWSLADQNISQANTPGIDLADPDRGICVQISSSISVTKVRHTLDEFFKHKLHEKYHTLYILFLSDKGLSAANYAKNIKHGFHFDPRKHVWTLPRLHRMILTAELEVLERIKALLDEVTGRILSGIGSDHGFLPLPPSPIDFIPGSRDAELDKLRQALQRHEPIYVSGPSGIGKTDLVLKFAWNLPVPKNVYYMKYTSKPRPGETFLQTTILEAAIDEPYTENDPNLRREELRRRLALMHEQLIGSILILDGFNLPEENLYSLRQDPYFKRLNQFGTQLVITTRYSTPYCACKVEALNQELLMKYLCECCESIQKDDLHICDLLTAFGCNTMMVQLVRWSVEFAKMSPEEIHSLHIATPPPDGAPPQYTPHLFLQNMRSKYEHHQTTHIQRTHICAFFKAALAFLGPEEPLWDWFHSHTVAEGGL